MYGTMFAIVFPFQRYFPPKSQWVLQETFCPGTPNPVNNPKSLLRREWTLATCIAKQALKSRILG
jgi:hypothetical protein